MTSVAAAERVDVLIVGAGFSGLCMLHKARRMGLVARVVESAPSVGGTYLGLMIAGFPNLFHIAGPGSTSAFTSVIASIEHHVDWIADCIAHLDAHGHTSPASRACSCRWSAAYADHCAAVAARGYEGFVFA